MAERQVFLFKEGKCTTKDVTFYWHSGMNKLQKQKNILELHNNFLVDFPHDNILEISTASANSLGVALSAFNLKNKAGISVENLYQGSKVFFNAGPFHDIYLKSALEAKQDERLTTSGPLSSFNYYGEEFSLVPPTAFYNWLYITTLVQNEDLANEVLKYNAFTDINFNKAKGTSCQAQAISYYKALHHHGLLDQALSSYESFLKVIYKK